MNLKIASTLFDVRIQAKNILIETSIEDYENLVKDIVGKNEFQRKRVRSSKSVYALLREDLLKQCVIPPIVLALTKNVNLDTENNCIFSDQINNHKEHLVILDGLQRTYTILDLLSELRDKDLLSELDEEERGDTKLKKFMNSKIRVEIYAGLDRLGILYRMLTLNTGQTPMSLRQQIEMLYLDYPKDNLNGIELIHESEGKNVSKPNQYIFRDIVEGFNAYLNRDELPIDKVNILENINSLEKLSKENQSADLFEKYLEALDSLVKKFNEECDGCEITEEYEADKGAAFGKNILKIFKRPQSISGFGAAIGKLIDYEALPNLDKIPEIVESIVIDDPNALLEEINDSLLWLKDKSKKIGNAQRSYFTFFFRDLLNKESDSFKDPISSSKSALRKYQAQNM